MEEVSSAKRPRLTLRADQKIVVLKTIIEGFGAIFDKFFPEASPEDPSRLDLHVDEQIVNIMFALHSIKRQQLTVSNLPTFDFKIRVLGNDTCFKKEELVIIWEKVVANNGLQYKAFFSNVDENWYIPMSIYLDLFSLFGLRLTELRIGHEFISIGTGKRPEQIRVAKYGLTEAGRKLLEGCTFPDAKKLSLIHTLGPMTLVLMMVKTDGQLRKKWENAVKKVFSYISCIDDIINVTNIDETETEIPFEVYQIVSCLNSIAVITTTRQPTVIAFPLCGLHKYYKQLCPEKRDSFLNCLRTTGPTGFYAYKQIRNYNYYFQGNFTPEEAAQIFFHCMFGSFKEDLGILSTITNVKKWYTREEIGSRFQKGSNANSRVTFNGPELFYYSKTTPPVDLTSRSEESYGQISSISVFSGKRTVTFSEDFFRYLSRIQPRREGCCMSAQQILSALLNLQLELTTTSKQGKSVDVGTTQWFSMNDLELDSSGSYIPDFIAQKNGRYW